MGKLITLSVELASTLTVCLAEMESVCLESVKSSIYGGLSLNW